VIALTGLLIGPVLATPAAAQDTGAVAVNTKDDSSVFKLAFSIKRVGDEVVDPGNAAVAYASCTGCETVAISFQIVLVSGEPDVVAPENVAIAINDQCTLCETLAMAYQWVFGNGDEPVHFTPEGRQRLQEIKKQFKDLKHQDLTLEEIRARVRALAEQVNDVVVNEMVASPPGQAKQTATSTTAAPTTTPTTSAALTTTTTTSATSTTTAPPPSSTSTTSTTAA
jgi:putative peptide zinc metalloprotease protein